MANGKPGFIKLCPKCGTQNPEYESLCQRCGFFIAMEPAQAAMEAPAAETAATQASPARPPVLQLSLPGSGLVFGVQSGDLLGQAHPESDARLQLPDSLPDIAFVHRRHCRFWLTGRQWQVEAIDHNASEAGFTNPTWVNGVPLAPGERRTLGQGDDLRLSATSLLVNLQQSP